MAGIFNKLKSGLNKGVATVGVKSKGFMETSRIKNEINNLNIEKNSLIIDLGETLFEMFKKSNFVQDILDRKCDILKQIETKISDRQTELENIVKDTNESLGKTSAVRFCECGAPLYKDSIFCSKCGKENKEYRASKDSGDSSGSVDLDQVCLKCGSVITLEKEDLLKNSFVCPVCSNTNIIKK